MDPVKDDDHPIIEPGKSYALSGKIMLTAIVILFAVVLFILAFHLYARWYLLRERRRQADRRRRRRAIRSQALAVPVLAADKGLEISVLNSLPVSLYTSSETEAECAVCLSEFEEMEVIRLLPKCNHSFHIGCIDMWFYSHSTCPLCRSPVEKFVSLAAGGSSSSPRPAPVRKCGDVRIDVPPRAAILPESPSSQSSPGSRLLALRRILSMGRTKSPATRCEFLLEEGIGESSRVRTASAETTS